MDDEPTNTRKNKRGRRRIAAGLRKHQHVDNVVVEEVFPLFDHNSAEKVGDGIYISATTAGNKRFYGVMVDQSSLKEASSLFFQNQSDSLLLNERMKTLNSKQHRQQQLMQGEMTSNLSAISNANVEDERVHNVSEQTTKVPSNEKSLEMSTHKIKMCPEKSSITGEKRDANELTRSSPTIKKARISSCQITNDDQSDGNCDSALKNTIDNTDSSSSVALFHNEQRHVQKFKYVEENQETMVKGVRDRNLTQNSKNRKNSENENYRILVATFSNVYEAACGNYTKATEIFKACEEGGNFLSICNGSDSYYYQYEVLPPSLTMNADAASKLSTIRTSMGFNSFLNGTALPPWYPLSNLYSQNKALNLLSIKQGDNGRQRRDHKGITTNNNGSKISSKSDVATIAGGTRLPMQPRTKKQYQIGVIGGGIAGLACCQELITTLKNDGIDAKVTLVEARSRLGGRIATDRSWKTKKGKVFPVELGAAWIHGIDDNPMATIAQNAGIEFVRVSEEVKMVDKNMKEVDSKMDQKMGVLFDDLLDFATEQCWTTDTNEQPAALIEKNCPDAQTAVRWYASCFSQNDAAKLISTSGEYTDCMKSMSVSTPAHRRSNDRSVDHEIGMVITKYKFRQFSKLTTEEHRMLLWNSKNVEYALGSNLDNLSMKYWDVDDRHAFEGDHVLLKEGYSAVIDHMIQSLKMLGSGIFEHFLNFPVGKVEYGRKSESELYGRDRYGRQLADLSDTCSITSEDGSETKYFDFLVSAVPLGVLKESVDRGKDDEFRKKITFVPSLPFCKIDAITNVGFGLLNKVYIQFSEAFWRIPGFFKEKDDCLFGNVTGMNPHHYMFFDVGKRLGTEDDSPAILMSLVSGKEAVALEYLPDADVIEEVIETLKAMFPESISIPEPISFRITRWGKDRFSRGSYTYLAPGSTDQDFQMLQSPVNSSGDSLLNESCTEAMRLFFAGEHTTALHPSVTHGAMLSGVRAAQEVVSTIQTKNKDDKDIDRVIPLSVFRYWNPTIPLQCNLCHKIGGRTQEGPLLVFKRGPRQVLVHNNCAEFCPEVEVVDFKWKNVIRAVNRGKSFTCCHCSQNGATIGCSANNCYRMFHFSCAEDTGWRFHRDGKVFYCDECRKIPSWLPPKRCDRISIKYYLANNGRKPLACDLCHITENKVHGKLLAFLNGEQKMCCVHLNCFKFSTILKPMEAENSRMAIDYENVFDMIDHSKNCSVCKNAGASIRCSSGNCDQVFHYHCAMTSCNWNFQRKGSQRFQCEYHRNNTKNKPTEGYEIAAKKVVDGGNENIGRISFQHDLMSQFKGTTKFIKQNNPGTIDIADADASYHQQNLPLMIVNDMNRNESSDDDDSFVPGEDSSNSKVMDLQLSCDVSGSIQLVHLTRRSKEDFWNISFQLTRIDNSILVTIAKINVNGGGNVHNEKLVTLQAKDIIVSINGSKVGFDGLQTLRNILHRLDQEVYLMLGVIRKGL